MSKKEAHTLTLDIKSKFSQKAKRAQEEMVGFIVIVVMVSIGLLILLGFLLSNLGNAAAVNDYEIEAFMQASLQYTTSCENQIEFLSLQNLIVSCEAGAKCLDETDSCLVLNDTLNGIARSSWNINNQSAIKGYKFDIFNEGQGIFTLKSGNITKNYKGGFQDFVSSGNKYEISLDVYY